MKQYKVNEVEVARKKILENAGELLDESKLLFEIERYARSYTLAHLSCEELSKIPMLVRAVLDNEAFGSFNWKELNKRLVDHTSKLKGFLLFNLEHLELISKILDIENTNDIFSILNKINRLKNSSLYSGAYNNDYLKPSEVITKDIATTMLYIATDNYEVIKNYESAIRGSLVELTDDKEWLRETKNKIDNILQEWIQK